MQFSALANDISNHDFDAYYQKCQRQKKLRLQSQGTVIEDSDTNSSGYSSASSSSSPTPSTYGCENDGVGDEDREMNSCQDYTWNGRERKYDYQDYETGNSINFGCSNSYSYSRFENSNEIETYTDEEIDRAFYEAEKWADF